MSDADTALWLAEKACFRREKAERFVARCREIATEQKIPPDRFLHAKNVTGMRERLLSKIGLPLPITFRQGEFAMPAPGHLNQYYSLSPDFTAEIGTSANTSAFIVAEMNAYKQRPFEDAVLVTSTVCEVGDRLIIDWRESRLDVRHLNILMLSYGCVQRFAAYVFVCSEEASTAQFVSSP